MLGRKKSIRHQGEQGFKCFRGELSLVTGRHGHGSQEATLAQLAGQYTINYGHLEPQYSLFDS